MGFGARRGKTDFDLAIVDDAFSFSFAAINVVTNVDLDGNPMRSFDLLPLVSCCGSRIQKRWAHVR